MALRALSASWPAAWDKFPDPMAEAKTKSEGAAKKSTRRPPKRKQVEDHARSYFEAIGRRDVDAAVDHWDPEGIEDVVPMRVFRGKDEIRGFLEENGFIAAE